MIKRLFVIKNIMMMLLLGSLMAPSVNASEHIELLVSRSTHTLVVQQGNTTLDKFKVAFGSGGKKAKRKEGDYRTPKGNYQISKIRNSDSFHLFMLLNYPSVDDAKHALLDGLITRKEYRAILIAQIEGRMPPQNTALGGAIGIHGIGVETDEKLEIHQFADWTKGCIAMRNDEIDALNRYITPGTRVIITD